MPYIEFEEFKDLTGKTDDFKAAFENHLSKATAILDSITNYFYQFNKIEEDPIGFRVKQFKLALCSQIIYFDEVGADTYESINNTPQSFSVGERVSQTLVDIILQEKMRVNHLLPRISIFI